MSARRGGILPRLAGIRSSGGLMLAMLMLAYACSAFDRYILSVLTEPIKAHFHVSDAQIGLLQGLAFVVVTSVAVVPIGWLVDRVRRIALIAAGIIIWSALTGLSAFAPSFPYLLIGRSGIALGDAILAPATYSLISDRFQASRRGAMIGLFHGVGGALGGLGLMAVGHLVEALEIRGASPFLGLGMLQPWQLALIFVSIPGFCIAAGMLLVADPPRQKIDAEHAGSRREIAKFYRDNAGFIVPHHLATGLVAMTTSGVMAWLVPFMIRVHSVSAGTAGMIAGAAYVMAHVGMMTGGWLSDRVMTSTVFGRITVCLWAIIPGALFAVLFPLTASTWIATMGAALLIALTGGTYAVATAVLQDTAPSPMRGIASAIYIFAFSIISAIGPLLIGAISDRFGIRIGIVAVLPAALVISALLFWRAARIQILYRQTIAVG